MRLLKQFFDFYIDASFHVALSVYAFIRITMFGFEVEYDETVSYFGFYGTIVGYNFIKYHGLTGFLKSNIRNYHKAIMGVSFISGILTGYYFFQLKWQTQIATIVFLVLTVFYALPFLPHKSNARNWSGLKIYLVCLSWAGVTVLLPVLDSTKGIDSSVWVYFIQRFILVFVLMLIFEISDLDKDANYLQTIPQQLGILKTKYLGYGLLMIYCLIEFFNFKFQLLTLALVFTISIFLFFVTPKRSKYYTSFWAEAMPIFWWVFMKYLI